MSDKDVFIVMKSKVASDRNDLSSIQLGSGHSTPRIDVSDGFRLWVERRPPRPLPNQHKRKGGVKSSVIGIATYPPVSETLRSSAS